MHREWSGAIAFSATASACPAPKLRRKKDPAARGREGPHAAPTSSMCRRHRPESLRTRSWTNEALQRAAGAGGPRQMAAAGRGAPLYRMPSECARPYAHTPTRREPSLPGRGRGQLAAGAVDEVEVRDLVSRRDRRQLECRHGGWRSSPGDIQIDIAPRRRSANSRPIRESATFRRPSTPMLGGRCRSAKCRCR